MQKGWDPTYSGQICLWSHALDRSAVGQTVYQNHKQDLLGCEEARKCWGSIFLATSSTTSTTAQISIVQLRYH